MTGIALLLPAAAPSNQGFLNWLAFEIRGNRFLYSFLFICFSYSLALSVARDDQFLSLLYLYGLRAARALLLVGVAGFVLLAARSLVQTREPPFRYIRKSLHTLSARGTVSRYLYGCTVLSVFMAVFLYNKMLIPLIAPFDWDVTFIEWDAFMIGGRHPWTLLHPVVATPAITAFLDFLYSIWVPLVFIFWSGLLVSSRVQEQLRRQYWISTMLSWIFVGVGMATLFSSAGPCFLPGILPGASAPYMELNSYLAEVNEQFALSSSLAKDYLWQVYQGAENSPGGISAMPSMHNAQSVLFTMVAYAINRRFGHVMLAYAVSIFIGSIHLAWHYAVDGLVGGAAALAIWWISGLISQRPNSQAA